MSHADRRMVFEKKYHPFSEWLRQIAPGLVSSIGLIARNSEVALNALLTDLLLPIIELSGVFLISTTKGICIDTAVVPEIAETISMVPEPVDRAAEPAEQHQQERYLGIHDVAQVSAIAGEVIAEMERVVKYPGPDTPCTGRVEITIGRPIQHSDAVIQCKVEKIIMLGLPNSGYYQACAHIILSGNVRFGVFTSYQEWIFMELLPDRRIVHSTSFNLMIPISTSLSLLLTSVGSPISDHGGATDNQSIRACRCNPA